MTDSMEQSELRSILLKREDDDVTQPAEELPLLAEAIKKAEDDLRAYLAGEAAVSDLAAECAALNERGGDLERELRACESEARGGVLLDLERALRDHDAVTRDLQQVDYSLQILGDVLTCGQYIGDFERSWRDGQLRFATERLADVADFLANPVDGFRELGFYAALEARVETLQREFSDELEQLWLKAVSWELQNETENSHVAILRTNNLKGSGGDALLALYIRKELQPKVVGLASFLCEKILAPLVRYNCEIISRPEEVEFHVDLDARVLQFEKIALNLKTGLSAISQILDVELHASDSFMKLIGREIGEKFGNILVNDCLVHTIPTNVTELKSYQSILTEAEKLQLYCRQIKLFPVDFSIMRFASDFESTFADKYCRHMLGEARKIMMRDANERSTTDVSILHEEKESQLSEDLADAVSVLARELPSSLFLEPKYTISSGARDLVKLLEDLLEQAVNCQPSLSERLLGAARLVFELYESVMPYYHQHFLLTMPYHVALFHNDCMWLSDFVLRAEGSWSARLAGAGLALRPSLLDVAPRLRKLGASHLATHVQQQRNQILDTIRNSDINMVVVRESLDESAERAVRQSLRQLQLLRNTWRDMLPHNLTVRLIGMLSGILATELVQQVCRAEDIPADMATQIADIYSLVLRNVPSLFQDGVDLEATVSSWARLQELVAALRGSLRDIERRWDARETHFTPRELRALVKALFQNTAVRADLLAKIK